MNGDGIEWIIDIIIALIVVGGWILRALQKKPNQPEPRSEPPAESAPSPELPQEARRLIAEAAARGSQSASAGTGANPFAGDALLESSYNELNLRDTEYLLQQWYEDDPEQWSDEAFAVIERILIERLGRLPSREETEADSTDEPLLAPDENIDPEIGQMWTDADLDGLARALRHHPDWLSRMDAAEALAAWGDPRGRQYLQAALADPADDVSAVARETLKELDDAAAASTPGARPAESAAVPIPASAQVVREPQSEVSQTPAASSDAWTAYRQKQMVLEAERAPASPESAVGTLSAWEVPTRSSGSSWKVGSLAGAAGGLLGFLGSALLLDYLLAGPLAAQASQIRLLILPQFYYVVLDLLGGAVSGIVANSLGRRMAGELSGDESPTNVIPMLVSIIGGAAAALVINLVLVWGASAFGA